MTQLAVLANREVEQVALREKIQMECINEWDFGWTFKVYPACGRSYSTIRNKCMNKKFWHQPTLKKVRSVHVCLIRRHY